MLLLIGNPKAVRWRRWGGAGNIAIFFPRPYVIPYVCSQPRAQHRNMALTSPSPQSLKLNIPVLFTQRWLTRRKMLLAEANSIISHLHVFTEPIDAAKAELRQAFVLAPVPTLSLNHLKLELFKPKLWRSRCPGLTRHRNPPGPLARGSAVRSVRLELFLPWGEESAYDTYSKDFAML